MDPAEKTRTSLLLRLKEAVENNELSEYKVVIMNDFSFDRLIYVDDFKQFMERAEIVLSQKGGLLPRSEQAIQQGGCAANTATTLARMGVKPYFISKTSELGLVLMGYYLERVGVDISHVKLGGTLALMSCFEVGKDRYNIMINDGESFGPFGFDDLEKKDFALMEDADFVGIFDWCLNKKGTDLAGNLLSYLDGQDIITYLDTSDPAPRKEEIPELFEKVLTRKNLTYLNLNENELKQYCVCPEETETPHKLIELTKKLKTQIPATLSIHTASFAIGLDDESGVSLVPSFVVNPRRTTGAGDTWNGGNILGILLKLEPEERLLLASAVAAYYVESKAAQRPTIRELIPFLEGKEMRKTAFTQETIN